MTNTKKITMLYVLNMDLPVKSPFYLSEPCLSVEFLIGLWVIFSLAIISFLFLLSFSPNKSFLILFSSIESIYYLISCLLRECLPEKSPCRLFYRAFIPIFTLLSSSISLSSLSVIFFSLYMFLNICKSGM